MKIKNDPPNPPDSLGGSKAPAGQKASGAATHLFLYISPLRREPISVSDSTMKISRVCIWVFAATICLSSLRAAPPAAFPDVNDLPVQTNMPDAMVMDDGTRVTTLAQWRERRVEIKAILEHYELGHPPPPPGNVKGTDIQSHDYLDGAVKYRLVHLGFGPDRKLENGHCHFHAGQWRTVPHHHQSFVLYDARREFHEYACRQCHRCRSRGGTPTVPLFSDARRPCPGCGGFSNQLSRGYAIVTYRYTQCGEDNTNFRSNPLLSRLSRI